MCDGSQDSCRISRSRYPTCWFETKPRLSKIRIIDKCRDREIFAGIIFVEKRSCHVVWMRDITICSSEQICCKGVEIEWSDTLTVQSVMNSVGRHISSRQHVLISCILKVCVQISNASSLLRCDNKSLRLSRYDIERAISRELE